MVIQRELKLKPYPQGFHLITKDILELLERDFPQEGLLNLFMQHTSAALTINENADPSVREDFETFIKHLVPESYPYFKHTAEGSDDMHAHIKSSLFGVSITLPISNWQLRLGTWQGVYLCEFRNYGGSRRITATILY